MISYNPHEAARYFTRLARRARLEIEEPVFVRELLEEAAYLLESHTPERLHRLLHARDVARVAAMLACSEHRDTIHDAIEELVNSLA